MSIEITFRVRVRDLLTHIDQTYGGLDGLAAYLAKHPRDSARILVYEAAIRNQARPDKVLTFGRMYLGETRGILSAARVEVLEHLMRNPGPSLRALARALERSPATISEHLSELESAGLVVREPHGPGRPVTLRALPEEVHIRLTPGAAEA